MTKRKGIKVFAIEKGNNILTFSIGWTFVPFLLYMPNFFIWPKEKVSSLLQLKKLKIFWHFLLEGPFAFFGYAKIFDMTKRKGIKVVAVEKGNNILTFSIFAFFISPVALSERATSTRRMVWEDNEIEHCMDLELEENDKEMEDSQGAQCNSSMVDHGFKSYYKYALHFSGCRNVEPFSGRRRTVLRRTVFNLSSPRSATHIYRRI